VKQKAKRGKGVERKTRETGFQARRIKKITKKKAK
jgi:hypothetical protein